ncbi:class I adenylate-forming enzyme family protein [Brevifollis gellanilyticus]|uniref:Fatty acid biosynthesis CoA ligase n=1 Tax=Brevifollis gellanilyticus TaxID=748831 RepID=A0A512M807_9BACT|nr:class I adenylate-forming enzyme family protein [Brevifollis gellanilyticus]GEP42481.1 fatty acid biosynthesis CoA ligase [Brevifollis gellanilyticus]
MSQTTLVNRIRSVFEENRDRVFLIESMTGRSWTFAKIHEWGLRGAALLKSHGISKGDRVALVLANSAEFAALYFSCLFIGAVAVPVNQALHTDDVSYILQHSGAKLLLFSRCTRSLILQATEKLNTLKQLRVALGQETSFHPEDVDEAWTFDQATTNPSIVPFAGASDDDTLLILFTSGTTGRPKGVVHLVRSEFGNAVAFNEAMQFGPEHRFLHIWPMAYSSGYLNTLMSPFMAGSSVVLAPAFTAQTILNFWKPVKDHSANTLWLSPTMMASLLRMDRDQDGHKYCRENVRTVCVGTAPLALKLKKDFEARYGVECMESYGLSELLILCANTPSHPRKENSVGRLLSGVELVAADEQGIHQTAANTEGELLARTECRMHGYLNAETLQVEELSGETWFPTGDIGVIDAEGNVFITGRKKDLIIRGGQNLSPRGIREVLLHHPSVEDAVVVGIPHDFYGEEVAAALRLKPGLLLADEQSDILTHCRKLLAQAAVPTKLKQVTEFPLGSTGKILNREVQALLAAKA